MYNRCIGYTKNNKKCGTRIKKSTNKYFCCTDHEPLNIEIITDSCIMCSEKIPISDVIILRCNHAFHKPCLTEWFEYSTSEILNCPLCRTDIKSQPYKKTKYIDSYFESSKLNILLNI